MPRVEVDKNGAVVLDQDFGTVFDDVLDELHANPSQSHATPAGPTPKELEQEKRVELEFCAAVVKQGTMRLLPAGITVVRCENEGGRGYRVRAVDYDGRPWEATVDFSEFERLPDEDILRGAIGVICDKLFEAKKLYMERFNQAMRDLES